jgi:hypothetical protein
MRRDPRGRLGASATGRSLPHRRCDSMNALIASATRSAVFSPVTRP